MPRINLFRCRKCGFFLPPGWGGQFYVVNDRGNRITPIHRSEKKLVVEEILGKNPSREVYRARTGFNSDALCLSCLKKFSLDTDWDERICPKCRSINVKTTRELTGKACPKCKVGVIVEIETGFFV